ncbi:MAG: ABC transporter permease [Bacteroidota bacterium]
MAAIPLSYNIRSLWTRRLTTILTIGGIALVVFVFTAVLMLAYGLKKTLVSTGSEDNVIVLRKSAEAEIMSYLSREDANTIKTFPELRQSADGKPLVSTEDVVIINLLKYGTGDMGNVTVRGVSPEAFSLRPQIRLAEGRFFTFGSSDVVVGKSIEKRFEGARPGQVLHFGGREWTIVGVMDANGSGFDSEIWGDVEQLGPAFGRPVFSAMTLSLENANDFETLKTRIEGEPRLQQLRIKREKQYYEDQSLLMTTFIRALGLIITIIFSLGAMIGAAITMYAAVANRTVEIGTLRALGFKRRNILTAFLMESMVLSLLGGIIGLFLATFMQAITISTTNFQNFSELAFGFALSPDTILWSMIFSIIMGIVGGFFPAVRAARLDIVTALRAG